MRVLQFINSLDTGGAERVVSTLALALARGGHTVDVMCLRDLGVPPVSEAEFGLAGVRVLALNKGNGISLQAVRAIAAYVRERGFDVIHSHNPLVNHYAVAASALAGQVPVVNTLHGISTLNMPMWARQIYAASCAVTNAVVPVCEAVADVCRTRLRLKDSRIRMIPNGIELNPFLASRGRSATDGFVFGTIGRLVPVKDHRTMLHAFAIARREWPDIRLEILGDGELRDELEGLARDLRIDDGVAFKGFGLDAVGFLSGLDCFVFSSVSEGLPLTVLEAMASGLPIVSTAVGGVPDLIAASQGGWLLSPGDPQAFSLKMQAAAACSRASLAEIGQRGRAWVSRHHSAEAMAAKYLELFSHLSH